MYDYTTVYLTTVDGHLGCFQFLSVMNNASIKIFIAIWEVPRPPCFNNSLEGLTELGKKGVKFTVMVYYSERIGTKSAMV